MALGHVGPLRQLQLQGVHAVRRPAVMAGDVAAGEAAVQHRAVTGRRVQDPEGARREAGVGAAPASRPQVEVGEPPVEEPRHARADGMGVEQDGKPEAAFERLELGRQPGVIRPPVGVDARPRLVLARGGAGPIDGLAIEGRGGDDLGVVGAGIEVLARRVAVEVDDVARMRRRQHAGTDFGGEAVQPPDVPVGVRQAPGLRGHARHDRFREMPSVMRYADQQRRLAGAKLEHLVHAGNRLAFRRCRVEEAR